MRIGTDGRVAVDTLELFAIDRCKLRCRHCAASSPFLTESNEPRAALVAASLAALEPVFRATQVKILGGEPLLNPDLLPLMRTVRESGVAERVRVTTNGTRLRRMDEAFWSSADVVEISVYPSTATAIDRLLPEAEKLAQRHGTDLEVRPVDSFQRAVSDARLPEDLSKRLFRRCGEAHEWSCHTLYEGRLYRCSRVHTLDRYLTARGIEHPSFTHLDGLAISDRPGLRDEIAAYLTSPEPLRACSFCLGTCGVFEAHGQMNQAQIRQALEAPPPSFDRAWIDGDVSV